MTRFNLLFLGHFSIIIFVLYAASLFRNLDILLEKIYQMIKEFYKNDLMSKAQVKLFFCLRFTRIPFEIYLILIHSMKLNLKKLLMVIPNKDFANGYTLWKGEVGKVSENALKDASVLLLSTLSNFLLILNGVVYYRQNLYLSFFVHIALFQML